MQLSKKAAAQELLKRRRARSNLVDFARYTLAGQYIPADHHHRICEKLEAVARGDIKRLMIFMPPRHGKSELASRRFPAWFLGNNPDKGIIAASYNSELAGDFGRDVRNIVASTEYGALFKTGLAADSKAAGRWHTDKGGGYVAAGVGTAITGRGAHVLLIDDPFKDRESADSETIRDKTYNWYMSTAYTRLESTVTEQDPDPLWQQEIAEGKLKPFEGAIVLIQTRWHEDDLAGRLLADMENGADQFEVLSLSAIDDKGCALWPGKYPIERLNEIKRALPDREWQALYQQQPTVNEGTFFKREWFKRYRVGEHPRHSTTYISSDFAVTADAGDFTELGAFCLSPDDDIFITDWWQSQATADVWVDQITDWFKEKQPMCFFGEAGVIRRSVEPFLGKRCAEKKAYSRIEWLTRTGDKAAMARAFQARASMGKVYVPHCDWGDRLINQLVAFPAGKHDDAVDVCALFGLALEELIPGMLPKPKEEPKTDAWGRYRRESNDRWKTM